MRLSKEVAKLIEYHNSIMNISYTRCKGCEVCDRIQKERNEKDKDPTSLYQHILDKKSALTFSDIVFLYEKEVPQHIIRKAAGIQHKELMELLEYADVPPIPTMQEVRQPKPKEKRFQLTKEEYEDMRSKGMNKTQIAAIAGVARGTLTYYLRRWNAMC